MALSEANLLSAGEWESIGDTWNASVDYPRCSLASEAIYYAYLKFDALPDLAGGTLTSAILEIGGWPQEWYGVSRITEDWSASSTDPPAAVSWA